MTLSECQEFRLAAELLPLSAWLFLLAAHILIIVPIVYLIGISIRRYMMVSRLEDHYTMRGRKFILVAAGAILLAYFMLLSFTLWLGVQLVCVN
jgi:hypothetical protein